MKIIRETVKELKDLSPSQMMTVHNLIISLKREAGLRRPKASARFAYRRAQRAFSGYKGNLSDDVSAMREDRV